MSNVSKRKKDGSKAKIKVYILMSVSVMFVLVYYCTQTMGDHKEFLKRITKTLYYGELPTLPCLSLPVTEISCSLWSVSQRGRSLRRLHADAAAGIARSACVAPCALVIAILYLERLKRCNPDYLSAAAPADLFLVSLMVSNKFLQDDGEDDEVVCSEWAASGGLEIDRLQRLEAEFLRAIDWNVFVSEKSFEAGLSWLEREVALKQAQARGFFTYGDLAAAGGGGAEAGAAACAACLACLAALLALVASALVLAHSLPAPASVPSPSLAASSPNGTVAVSDWSRYSEATEASGDRDGGWGFPEPRWSRTSVLNWLCKIPLIDPVQRWLEKTYRYADLLEKEIANIEPQKYFLGSVDRKKSCDRHCFRQWLNFSKLSVIVASVSDR